MQTFMETIYYRALVYCRPDFQPLVVYIYIIVLFSHFLNIFLRAIKKEFLFTSTYFIIFAGRNN